MVRRKKQRAAGAFCTELSCCGMDQSSWKEWTLGVRGTERCTEWPLHESCCVKSSGRPLGMEGFLEERQRGIYPSTCLLIGL